MYGLHPLMGRDRSLRSAIASRFHAPGVARAHANVIVFADDWGRHPSSAQHLVRHLLSDFTVAWVNTIGTRAPKLSAAAVGRGVQKLLTWSGGRRAHCDALPAPQLFNPLMYPGFRSRWQRRVNADLLARFLHSRFNNLPGTAILTTLPIVADLPERVQARRWIYYCVDDFSTWPGLDCNALRSMEQKFVVRADRIVAAGDNLSARMHSLGRSCRVISHGIDLEHWRSKPQPTSLLSGLERPVALFWGLIDRRLDLKALQALDRSMPGTIVLVGPVQDPDPGLDTLAHVRKLGPKPYHELPALAAAADVLIMPYADLPVTRAMQPLKLKEYLATARPVVSTRLPAVIGWGDCLDIADDPAQFATAVLYRSKTPLPKAQAVARERLQAESWKSKAADLAEVVFGE